MTRHGDNNIDLQSCFIERGTTLLPIHVHSRDGVHDQRPRCTMYEVNSGHIGIQPIYNKQIAKSVAFFIFFFYQIHFLSCKIYFSTVKCRNMTAGQSRN